MTSSIRNEFVRIFRRIIQVLFDQVNRDPLAAEMLRMRQQLELMQAELLCARAGGPSNTEVQVLVCILTVSRPKI